MFIEYFGNTPRARLLDVLGAHPAMEFDVSQLAGRTGMTRQTVESLLRAVLPTRMVRRTRTILGAPLYAIDLEHPVVLSILRLDLLRPGAAEATVDPVN